MQTEPVHDAGPSRSLQGSASDYRGWRPILLAGASLVLAVLLDRWAYAHFYDPHVYGADWGRTLRVMGYLPVWILGAVALALQEREPGASALRSLARLRPSLLLWSPTLAGAAAEVMKLLIRRERPWAHAGASVFRPWSDRPFYNGGLATPSSHAAVAFGAAFALGRLYPRTAVVWYALAAGCAFTRVAAHAHFMSDVVLAALVAWAVVAVLWRRLGRRRPSEPADHVAATPA
jgi:membrane-associated phospholipid phosphatase